MEPKEFMNQLRPIQATLDQLIKSSHETRILRDGLRVALLGKPNVGKSSLLNLLISRDRAIVHPESGTTRDTIEESVNIRGVPVTFVDTAGIRMTSDIVEQHGVARSRQELEQADIPVVVFDASQPPDKDDRRLVGLLSHPDQLFILNKCDLDSYNTESYSELMRGGSCVKTSATIGTGLDELLEEIIKMAQYNPARFESGLVINARQGELLGQAKASLARGVDALVGGLGGEIVAIDLRECVRFLDVLVGKDIGDAVLDHVFSSFCIGK